MHLFEHFVPFYITGVLLVGWLQADGREFQDQYFKCDRVSRQWWTGKSMQYKKNMGLSTDLANLSFLCVVIY